MTIADFTTFQIGIFPYRPMLQIGGPDSLANIRFPAEFSTCLLFADELVLFPHGPGMGSANECVVTTEMHSATRSLGVPFSWGFDLEEETLEELERLDEAARESGGYSSVRGWNFLKTDEEIAALVAARCSALLGADPVMTNNTRWDTYQAVAELQRALQQVCLPALLDFR